MNSRRAHLLAAVSVLLLGLACRYTAPTPVAWVPTATAEQDARTRVALATDSASGATRVPASLPTKTNTPYPRPTAAEDGPWLIFPNAVGERLYALDQDSGTLIPIALPELTDPRDIIGGRAMGISVPLSWSSA